MESNMNEEGNNSLLDSTWDRRSKNHEYKLDIILFSGLLYSKI